MLVSKTVAFLLLAAVSPAPEWQTAHDNATKLEQAQVVCMKEAGLEYRPLKITKATRTETDRKQLNGDYAAMKEHRTKYGFGVWSQHVYPDRGVDHPNDKVVLALPEKEHKSYLAALDRCFAQAAKSVLGKDVTSRDDYAGQLEAAFDKGALDGDAKLVALGKDFAACLKVPAAKPTELADRGRKEFLEQRSEVARKQGVRAPVANAILIPAMKPAEAKPYLAKEVAAALADLKCGKDFYAAYQPKAWQLQQKVYAEYGVPYAW